jgi:hypothetical protein
MCAVYSSQRGLHQRGKPVEAFSETGRTLRVWRSWARVEKIDYWRGVRKATPAEIVADRFAERDRRTHALVWADIPPGLIIRALLVPTDEFDLFEPTLDLLIVTRAAEPAEVAHFGHDRLPLLAAASLATMQ